MNTVEIEAKDNENDLLWKKKNGDLVRMSSLSDEELINARKISCNLSNSYFNKKEKALRDVKKYSDISELHSNLLEALDIELSFRKQEYAKKVQTLEYAEKEI